MLIQIIVAFMTFFCILMQKRYINQIESVKMIRPSQYLLFLSAVDFLISSEKHNT